MEHMQEQQLLALQGKAAQRVIERLTPGLDLSCMPFMTSQEGAVAGIPVRITRCGNYVSIFIVSLLYIIYIII
jgi:glycine cleavage system aminomethyltransferase T